MLSRTLRSLTSRTRVLHTNGLTGVNAIHNGTGGGGGGGSTAVTDFVMECSRLKKRMRGKGQYAFARELGKEFLDTHVPKTGVADWMERGGNAVALAQLLRFFELEPHDSLNALMVNKLVRVAEDASCDVRTRTNGVLMLLNARPEENYERAISTVEDIVRRMGDDAANDVYTRWFVLETCAKVLQLCGRRVPTSLADRLCALTLRQLEQAAADDYRTPPHLQGALLRLYSWMVRCERPEAAQVLAVLVKHTGRLQPYDYATLMHSCGRHHRYEPLPADLTRMLALSALQYATSASGRDVSHILAAVAKFRTSESPAAADAGAADADADARALNDAFHTLLEQFQPRCLHFLDPTHPLYWRSAEDVTNVVFAYELGSRRRYSAVFQAYAQYAEAGVARFEPAQLALATGVLRRCGLLSAALAAALAGRIEAVLGELRLPELAHVCVNFAALGAPLPAWMEEAKTLVLRLLAADTAASTRLHLILAFPEEPSIVAPVDYAQVRERQLVDALALARLTDNKGFTAALQAELTARLAAPGARFSPDDVFNLLHSGAAGLVAATRAYMARCFAAPVWDVDTLLCLPMLAPEEQAALGRDAGKALAAAKAASVAARQFASLVEVLLGAFGDADADINQFVRRGGLDLLQPPVLDDAVVRYLAAVRAVPAVRPGEEWLAALAARPPLMRRSPAGAVESMLISLRTVYTDVATHSALLPVLVPLVERCAALMQPPRDDASGEPVPPPTPADREQAARLTVLLAYLQRGAARPLVTARTPFCRAVVENIDSFPQALQDTLRAMPLPPGTDGAEPQRLGRFVLKKIPPPPVAVAVDPTMAHATLAELSQDLLEDPFEVSEYPPPPAPAAQPQGEPEAVAPATEQRQQEEQQPPALQAEEAAETTTATTTAAAAATTEEAAAQPQQSQQQQTEVAETAQTEEEKGKEPSYYAKFFSNSLRGLKGSQEGEKTNSEQQPEEPPQPQQQGNSSDAQPTGWGAPAPAASAPPPPPPPPPPAPPARSDNATAFSQLFVQGGATPQQTPQHNHQQQQQQHTQQQHHATSFGALFGGGGQQPQQQQQQTHGSNSPVSSRPAAVGGNIFFDPANPSGQPQPPQQRQPPVTPRPATHRRATITRAAPGTGVAFNPLAASQQQQQQQPTQPPAAPTPPPPPPPPPPPQQQQVSQQAPELGRLAWQEATRRVSRSTRGGAKAGKGTSRTQQSLSAWLNSSPDVAMLTQAAAAGGDLSQAADTQNQQQQQQGGGASSGSGKRRGRPSGKGKSAGSGGASSDAGASAAPTGGKGGRGAKGKGAAKASAATTKAAATKGKGGKAASAAAAGGKKGAAAAKKGPKSAAKKVKAAAASSAKGGKTAAAAKKAKAAAAKPKPKPKPKAKAKAAAPSKAKKAPAAKNKKKK